MKTKKIVSKSLKYLLANQYGVLIYLYVPSEGAGDQKYYLDYNFNGRKKYYGKGLVKEKTITYFSELKSIEARKKTEIEAQLAEIFNDELELILHESQSVNIKANITMRSTVKVALETFYSYKQMQNGEGTVSDYSLYGYKHHTKKLTSYFNLNVFNKLTLNDLNADLWQAYRISLINNSHGLNTKMLINTSVNQHFQYVTQFYTWLIDYNEFPIKNHLKKLKKLNTARQEKRFKPIPKNLFDDFYYILEHKEKYTFTRLYLSGLLLYENNIRISEQVLVQVGDIDLVNGAMKIINKKNDSLRTVILSTKVKELITIIRNNTIEFGLSITDDMYLFGGHNIFKSGKPHRNKEVTTLMRRFRKIYPQFRAVKLYENKHTSITNQFNAGIDHYKIKERANHSSISTTEIYLKSSKVVMPYEFINDLEIPNS